MLDVIAFPGGHDSRIVQPHISPDMRAHYDALAGGRLVLPRCNACRRVRFPATPACMWCAQVGLEWIDASGRGRVHSWVRYHRAYLPAFEPLVPYEVLAVELEEGPVLFGRLVTKGAPRIGQPVRAVAERWADGFCGLAFELMGETT